jgi:hypothetical protein
VIESYPRALQIISFSFASLGTVDIDPTDDLVDINPSVQDMRNYENVITITVLLGFGSMSTLMMLFNKCARSGYEIKVADILLRSKKAGIVSLIVMIAIASYEWSWTLYIILIFLGLASVWFALFLSNGSTQTSIKFSAFALSYSGIYLTNEMFVQIYKQYEPSITVADFQLQTLPTRPFQTLFDYGQTNVPDLYLLLHAFALSVSVPLFLAKAGKLLDKST